MTRRMCFLRLWLVIKGAVSILGRLMLEFYLAIPAVLQVGADPGLAVSALMRYLGTLVGIYASRGGRKGVKDESFAHFTNWIYEGLGQKVDYDLIVPSY